MSRIASQRTSIICLFIAGAASLFLALDAAKDGDYFSAAAVLLLGAGLWFGACFKLI
jgi:hypothetical protein